MNEGHNGVKISFYQQNKEVDYDIEIIASPRAIDTFIASKMVFWFRNEVNILITDEVKQYTDFEVTRRYFTKRMLREDGIMKQRFFEKER